MTENTDAHSQLVEQKMQARAERHVRELQAQQEDQGREAQAALAAKTLADHAEQKRTLERQRQEAIAEARRNRPELLARYKSNPIGVRHVATLQEVCLNCGSERIRLRSDNTPNVLVCWECSTEWYVSPCWSCTTGVVDSRDPETPPCERCGRPRCAVCGACNIKGCSTNPYHAGHRQRDAVVAPDQAA